MEERPTPSTPTTLPSPRVPDPTQFPTTFVQADTASFKQIVQMLTGTADTAAAAAAKPHPIPPKPTGPKKPAFKLYERRNIGLKNTAHHLNIVSPAQHLQQHYHQHFHQRQQQRSEIPSPSALDFPSLVLSPVTPLVFDPEDKAIAEKKGFYLIPSPRSASSPELPRLLPLFPLTSPRATNNSGSPAS